MKDKCPYLNNENCYHKDRTSDKLKCIYKNHYKCFLYIKSKSMLTMPKNGSKAYCDVDVRV